MALIIQNEKRLLHVYELPFPDDKIFLGTLATEYCISKIIGTLKKPRSRSYLHAVYYA
jgi:hypothetical protein